MKLKILGGFSLLKDFLSIEIVCLIVNIRVI